MEIKTVHLKYSEINTDLSEKANLVLLSISDKVIETDFIIPCHSGAKLNVSKLPDYFCVHLWIPKSVMAIDARNKVIAITGAFVDTLFSRLINPLGTKQQMLFMYIKKLWIVGADSFHNSINEGSIEESKYEMKDQTLFNDAEAAAKTNVKKLNPLMASAMLHYVLNYSDETAEKINKELMDMTDGDTTRDSEFKKVLAEPKKGSAKTNYSFNKIDKKCKKC